jgi:hypothetical protein
MKDSTKSHALKHDQIADRDRFDDMRPVTADTMMTPEAAPVSNRIPSVGKYITHQSPTTAGRAATASKNPVAPRTPPRDASAASSALDAPPTKPQETTMDLARLIEHPLQAVYNPPCSPAEDAMLEADLSRGQRNAIHVMPPGNRAGLSPYTILDGHRRWAILRRLGVTFVMVIIRWDLLNADAAAVEAEFLQYNQNRRQLDSLSLAKNLKRQMELSRGRPLDQDDRSKLARTISEIAGNMTIRNAQRYVYAADAVPEIQAAYRRGDITLTLAAQVGALEADEQQEIVAAIQGIGDRAEIRRIVSEHIRNLTPSWPNRTTSYTRRAIKFVVTADTLIKSLHLTDGSAHGPSLIPHVPSLVLIKTIVTKLIANSKRPGVKVPDFTSEEDS